MPMEMHPGDTMVMGTEEPSSVRRASKKPEEVMHSVISKANEEITALVSFFLPTVYSKLGGAVSRA